MEFEFTVYRVVVPVISLFFITYAWNHVKRGTKTLWEAILWTLFWGFVCAIVIIPERMNFLTAWTGIKDQENAVFAIMIGILLFAVFHILVRLERIQKRITDLVRHEALEDAGLMNASSSRKKEFVIKSQE